MKISLDWLRDFLPSPLDAAAAADALTMGGLPVENIETHAVQHTGEGPPSASDTVIDVEVTSNRGDCLSHVGVARELAALLGRDFRPVQTMPVAFSGESPVRVAIEAPELCPHYTARIIRGVKIGPSPAWMVRRLEAVGVRSINNVVDITNYVMFEIGQPLHAFDLARIGGRQIIVRTAAAGEKITSIDARLRELTGGMLVIADASHPVALAGVMGGMESEVSPATNDVLLESARFDALSVRKTARALAMASDSSYRFERGIDPTLPLRASLRATQLIVELAGGQVVGDVVQAGGEGYQPKPLSLRLSRLRQVLGVELPTKLVVEAFARLGLSPGLKADRIDVIVPSHRLDISQEIDLVEEAARLVGYDKIPTRQEISIRLTPPDGDGITIQNISQTLVSGGYFEAVTFSFVSDALRDDFTPTGATLLRADASVRKADASLRPSLIPGLLESLRLNENAGVFDARLFEMGSTFVAGSDGGVEERRTIAWVGGGELRQVRGMVEAVLRRLDADRAIEVVADTRAGFAAGACGRVEWDGRAIGYVGLVDRAVAQKASLRQLPAAAELDLAPLLAGARHVPQLHPLPTFPAVRRDLSLLVADAVTYQAIAALVRKLDLPMLESMEFVGTYRGKQMDKGVKSVTFTLVFRSPGGTLTSEQVDEQVRQVVQAAAGELKASLR